MILAKIKRILVKDNPLFFAFAFPAITDAVVTLVGQKPEYWNTKIVNEASPAFFALQISPWLFVSGSGLWFIFWYHLFKRLREPGNLFLAILFIVGHSWGSSSWIWNLMKRNGVYTPSNQLSVIFVWGLVVLYFAIVALLATYSLKVYFSRETRK